MLAPSLYFWFLCLPRSRVLLVAFKTLEVPPPTEPLHLLVVEPLEDQCLPAPGLPRWLSIVVHFRKPYVCSEGRVSNESVCSPRPKMVFWLDVYLIQVVLGSLFTLNFEWRCRVVSLSLLEIDCHLLALERCELLIQFILWLLELLYVLKVVIDELLFQLPLIGLFAPTWHFL